MTKHSTSKHEWFSNHDFKSLTESDANPDELAMLEAVRIIDSLTNPRESLALYRLCSQLPDGARVLEIGSFNGASAVAMGHALKNRNGRIHCIDPWSDYVKQEDFSSFKQHRIADDNRIINNFINNTNFLGNQVKMMRGFSSDFAGMIAGQDFDLIFIDGDHHYESVKNDILMCLAALKPGGVLTGHDYHSMAHGVRKAVDEMIGHVTSIRVKGTINETYIWFAVIDDPEYLLLLAKISEYADTGDFNSALDLAKTALTHHKTPELIEMISLYKTQLFMAIQGKGTYHAH